MDLCFFLKGGVGLLAALWMKEIKLETVTDEVCKILYTFPRSIY